MNTSWSKYRVFDHFTDFNFVQMSDKSFEKFANNYLEGLSFFPVYPAKGSIVLEDNNVVVFLTDKDIVPWNTKNIYKNRASYTPVAQSSGFRLYYKNNMLCYEKENPSAADKAAPVFLHIVPEDAQILSADRKVYGYEGRDFRFDELGIQGENNALFACQPLPQYPIKEIHTGQYVPLTKKQKLFFVISEANKRRKEAKSLGAFFASVRTIKRDIQTEKLTLPGRVWETKFSLGK